MVPWWRSFAIRIVGIYTAATTLAAILGVFSLYQRERAEVEGKFGLALETIASTTAPFLSGDDLDLIKTNADVSGASFSSIAKTLERIREENNLRTDQIYVLRARPDGKYEFAVMLQTKAFVGDRYEPPPQLLRHYGWVQSEKDAIRTKLYSDAHGTFISGIAPILRKDGSVAGLLQVDYGVDMYLGEVRRHGRTYLAGLGLVIAVFLVFGVYMQRRVKREVTTLLRGTQAIEAEEYDHRIQVRSRDEVGLLGQALNQVLTRLKERFEMLKFLPPHTAQMIRDAAEQGGVNRSIARTVEVSVFESDIRGFTALSQELSAEDVVKMLNDYIRIQAEIIERHGGSIDKYMGDAVLAIFEGDQKEERAVSSALSIQAALTQLNASSSRPIHVGIGITVGELVMGNMGSDQRMEFTVIGSPVNLAARLCSQAAGEEVVISEEVKKRIPAELAQTFEAPEKVSVKGFEHPVVCYRALSAG